MTPRQFWHTTPALFNSLTNIHSEINNKAKPKVARTIEEAGIDI